MLSLSRKSDYTLVAMAELAHRRRSEMVSARDISQAVGVPLPMLTNVLHAVQKAGLVVSRKGARGGYMLAREPETITLAEMIAAVEGPAYLTACCTGERTRDEHVDCTLQHSCRVRVPIQRVQQGLREFLSSVTLNELASDETVVEIGIANELNLDDQ